jgi:hypothetical protein
MKDIRNYNSKGQHHGYQETYYVDVLWYRGNLKNDNFMNYVESHNWKETKFYII